MTYKFENYSLGDLHTIYETCLIDFKVRFHPTAYHFHVCKHFISLTVQVIYYLSTQRFYCIAYISFYLTTASIVEWVKYCSSVTSGRSWNIDITKLHLSSFFITPHLYYYSLIKSFFFAVSVVTQDNVKLLEG